MSELDVQSLQAEVNRLKLEVNALKVEDRSEQIFIGNYLLARLEQLGVKASPCTLLAICG
jgi:pyruvate decarboxylase